MTPKITVADDGLARLDGIPMFRVIDRAGVIILQFQDRDRLRAQCRGSKFVEIPLGDIMAALTPVKEKADER
jgi:hypothetical protein